MAVAAERSALVNTEEATLHGDSGPPSGTLRQVGAHVQVLITRTCGVSLLSAAAHCPASDSATVRLSSAHCVCVCARVFECACRRDGRRLPPKLKEFGRFLTGMRHMIAPPPH